MGMGGQPSPKEPETEALGQQPGSKSTMKSQPGQKKGSLQSRLSPKKSTSSSSSTESTLAPNEFAGDDASGERFAPPAVKQLEEERFCISDDTCVDYSGTDYICVAGKCVPMGGQPSPESPEAKELGQQPGSKS